MRLERCDDRFRADRQAGLASGSPDRCAGRCWLGRGRAGGDRGHLFITNFKRIAELAIKQRLPSISFIEYADAGGLFGYGANFLALYRRAPVFVDKIIKGAKPADIPIERPTTFELVINLKTAKALGLTLTNSTRSRADREIE